MKKTDYKTLQGHNLGCALPSFREGRGGFVPFTSPFPKSHDRQDKVSNIGKNRRKITICLAYIKEYPHGPTI